MVPITFVVVAGLLYTAVDHKPKRTRRLRRLANIGRHPAVSVLIDHYEDDWSRLWWARLDGDADVLHAGREFDSAVAALQEKYPQYRDAPPAGPVIRIALTGVTTWAASAQV